MPHRDRASDPLDEWDCVDEPVDEETWSQELVDEWDCLDELVDEEAWSQEVTV